MNLRFRIAKQRRGHLEELERDEHGNFKQTGGPGSQGGRRKTDENRTDSHNGEPPPKGHDKPKGKGGDDGPAKVGSIPWFSKTEQMHRPVPNKLKKPGYVSSHNQAEGSKSQKASGATMKIGEIIQKALAEVAKATDMPSEAAPAAPAAADPNAGAGGSPGDAFRQMAKALGDVASQMDSGGDPAAIQQQLQTIATTLGQSAGIDMLSGSDEPDMEPAMMSIEHMSVSQWLQSCSDGFAGVQKALEAGNVREARARKSALKTTIEVGQEVYGNGFSGHVPVYKSPADYDTGRRQLGLGALNQGDGPGSPSTTVSHGSAGKPPAPPTQSGSIASSVAEAARWSSMYGGAGAKKSLEQVDAAIKSAAEVLKSAGCMPDDKPKEPASKSTDDAESVKKGLWTDAFIHALPDTSFLYVAPGAAKDEKGRSAAESRFFPIADAEGQVNQARVTKAVADLPGVALPPGVKGRLKARLYNMVEAAQKSAQVEAAKKSAAPGAPAAPAPRTNWSSLFPAV